MSESKCIRVLLVCALIAISNAAGAAAVPAPPAFVATSYLVMDYRSGFTPVQHNVDARLEPASLTKMMTVYVVAAELEAGHIGMDDMVTVSEKAWRMAGSKMFIEVDKQVSVSDLLKGVIVQSGNDASVALAEHVAGSEEVFAEMMNRNARRLGMTRTHFVNSTGWPDEQHYTTAQDMARLAAALIRDYPEIYSWHALKEFTFNKIRQVNRNELLWQDESVDGIKTGHTETAGFCLVASAEREGTRLISVVMGAKGSKARVQATESLLNYVYRFYQTRRLFAAGDAIADTRVWKGTADTLPLGIEKDLYVTVPRGSYAQLQAAAEVRSTLVAPVEKGATVGDMVVRLQGEELLRRPLLARESVPEAGLFKRLADEVRLFLQ